MEKNFAFMAFAKGQVSTEAVVMPKYIGVAPVTVLAVNPNKAALEKIYGRTLDDEPTYVTETKPDENGKVYPSVRINFIVKTDAEKCNGIDMTTGISFFIQKRYRQGSQSGKYQIIDKYGRTAWATKAEIEAKQIPTYSNGPANIDADYRPCYVGEEELTSFLKNYMNIPNVQSYVNGAWVPNEKINPEDCEARLESIDNYFKGDFKELSEIIACQPNNKVKVLFGVRTSDDNKQYQSVYTQMTLKNSATDYSRLDADVQQRKQNGAYSTTEFEVCDLKEYTVEASNLENTASAGDMPFDALAGEASPW